MGASGVTKLPSSSRLAKTWRVSSHSRSAILALWAATWLSNSSASASWPSVRAIIARTSPSSAARLFRPTSAASKRPLASSNGTGSCSGELSMVDSSLAASLVPL